MSQLKYLDSVLIIAFNLMIFESIFPKETNEILVPTPEPIFQKETNEILVPTPEPIV